MIGLLMLIGIVVTNAIVLIDLINHFRVRGVDLRTSIVHGARLRYRPILMTAAATIFALLPMALGLTGGGVFISKPLAIVVIGGLVSSTLLTLILVPVLYLLLEGVKERRAEKKHVKNMARGEVLDAAEARSSQRETATVPAGAGAGAGDLRTQTEGEASTEAAAPTADSTSADSGRTASAWDEAAPADRVDDGLTVNDGRDADADRGDAAETDFTLRSQNPRRDDGNGEPKH